MTGGRDDGPVLPPPLPDNPYEPWHGWRREWPIMTVLAVLAAGLVIVANHYFRRGTVVFAAGVWLAVLLRVVLPEKRAGMLRVRSRPLDVAALATLATATAVLALAVPPPG